MAETDYIVKHVEYKLDPKVGIDIEPKDYMISKSNGSVYTVSDGPFSAKGFFILDSNSYEQEGSIFVEYIVSTNTKEAQWEKYKGVIVDPIISKFWRESMQIAHEANEKFAEYSDEDLQEIQQKVTEFAKKQVK